MKTLFRFILMGVLTYVIVGYIDYETTSLSMLFSKDNLGFALLFTCFMAILYYLLFRGYNHLTNYFRKT